MVYRRSIHLVPCIVLAFLASCTNQPRFDSVAAVNKLFTAWESRDEQTVRNLLADDIHWVILGQTYTGKDQVINFLKFDAAMESHVQLSSTSTSGDTVLFDLIESNKFMTDLGVPQIRNHGRIVFANGKVKDIADVRPPDGEDKLDAASGAFFAWVQEKHPEALAHLSAKDGTPFISDDAGKTLIALSSEWSAVTKK